MNADSGIHTHTHTHTHTDVTSKKETGKAFVSIDVWVTYSSRHIYISRMIYLKFIDPRLFPAETQ